MQSKLTGISFAIIVLLAILCFWQQQQLSEARQRLGEVRQIAQATESKQAAAEKKVQQLEQIRSDLEGQVSDLVAEGSIMRATIARSSSQSRKSNSDELSPLSLFDGDSSNAPDESGNFQKGMAKWMRDMMKDPAMKEMIEAQQKSSIGQMYGSLFKSLKLSSEDKEKFVDLLMESQSAAMENIESLWGEDQSAKTNLIESITQKQKATDEKLRALLGENNYARYQEYQGTIGERMQLDQFQAQLTGTDSELKENQMEQLLQLMKDERMNNPPVFSGHVEPIVDGSEKMMSEESMEKHLQWQEKLNQRVLEGSAQILSQDQAKQFKAFQDQQLSLQRLGIKMAAGMFGTKSNATENIQVTPTIRVAP